MRAGRYAPTAVLAGLTLLGTGGATGFLLRPAPAPEQLRGAAEVRSAPVGQEQLTDDRTVKISLTRSTPPPLVVGLAGRVTSTSCRPGRALTSGQAVARIGDTPLIALATAVPLHRDLARGDKGDDVRALQRELRRLGRDVGVTGRYDKRTAAAVKAVQKAAGVAKPDGKLTTARILWLSAAQVTPTSCDLVQGGYASAGQAFGKAPARLTAVSAESMPAGLVPGDREIRVLGVAGPLGDGGTATDPAFLDKITMTPGYRLLEASGKDAELTATVALRTPIATAKVPPGALYGVDGAAGCVESGTATYPVTIVGSRLGATLVTGNVPAQVDLGADIAAEECR